MQIIDNIPVWGTQVDEGALKQIRTCYGIFGQAAMMADHHKGYGVPIGGVIAHEYLTRGLGHKIATRFLNRAGAKDDMDSVPVALDARTQEGQGYIAAMKLAGRYAYAGRDWVCDRVVKILGARVLESVHNHHNFAWRETHDGKDLWVVRKGATPAFPGQKGFVGGTMGETSVILEGVENR